MIQAFNGLKNLVQSNRRNTESLVFYLHYRVTFLVLLFCCILVSTHQFSWAKIQCLSKPSGTINLELLNSYCWAASTYSVHISYLEEAGIPVPHPGVASSEKEFYREYRNFYQYVHIVLFIQAVLFYIPHLVWKGMERNFMRQLITVINNFESVTDQTNSSAQRVTDQTNSSAQRDTPGCKRVNTISVYIEDRWGSQKSLVLKYLFCEILSIANVMAQSYLLNKFFLGKFYSLGTLVDAYYGSGVFGDPIQLFPLVTICKFKRYGASGYIDVIDSLCVLPNNAVNAKIYICLWFWFLAILILSCFNLIDLLFCICVPFYKTLLPRIKSIFSGGKDDNQYVKLLTLGDFGDWFVLSSIQKEMDDLDFTRLVEKLHLKLGFFETKPKEV